MEAKTEELRRDLRRLLLLKMLAGEPLGLLILEGMVDDTRARLRNARQSEAGKRDDRAIVSANDVDAPTNVARG
jgi:hypothetical protein